MSQVHINFLLLGIFFDLIYIVLVHNVLNFGFGSQIFYYIVVHVYVLFHKNKSYNENVVYLNY